MSPINSQNFSQLCLILQGYARCSLAGVHRGKRKASSFHSRRAQIQISSPGDSTDAASVRLGHAVRGPQTGFVLTSVRLDSMHITPTIRGLTYKVVIAYLGQDERSTVTTAKP